MDTTTRRISADELLGSPDDGMRHELVGGELRTMTPSGSEHGWVTSDLHESLAVHVRRNRLGRVFAAETGFLLARDPDTVLAPDVAFVRRERVRAVGRHAGYWPGAPDLAIEVVSPNDRPAMVADKVASWLRYGAGMVVVVDPRRRVVSVHRPGRPVRELTEADTLDGEDVVAGWSLAVGTLFADDLDD